MRPPVFRRWTGNAACAASLAASRSSGLKNLGSETFFSEFRVSNSASKSSYRVAIRGLGLGGNFCSCPDYATSELGTCKHIEFTLCPAAKKSAAPGRRLRVALSLHFPSCICAMKANAACHGSNAIQPPVSKTSRCHSRHRKQRDKLRMCFRRSRTTCGAKLREGGVYRVNVMARRRIPACRRAGTNYVG
jgi:hypothetical protein